LFKNNTRNKQLNEAQAMLHNNKLSEEVQADLKQLNEDVVLKVYSQNDPYIHYVEMVQDPGEMFDLQKFGKTHGYIKASTRKLQYSKDDMFQYLNRYKVEQKDVEIYDAMSFVHGCIEGTTQRQLDTIDIFLDQNKDDDSNEDSMTTSYSVKRGQSLLYNSFRIWRELNLLEMSALLNRLTKSSLIRIMNVEVGDMPKEQVRVYIQRLKEKMEQKTGVDVNNALTSYNNPGPIENTIYVPTHNGQGAINPTNIGGDFDPKALTDIEYFRDKLFGSLKVPKQFFGFTADGAGFNGGASLSIISSRYGKTIKKLQNILCQMITDVINLFLIDRGMHNYVNQFTVRMQTPVTQEEQDRRTNTDNRIRYVGDLMNQLNIIEDNVTKLKIYKILLTNCINDSDVITIIQEHIEALEAKLASEKENSSTDANNANIDFSTSGENDDQLPEVPISLENTENDETSENISLENFYNDSDKDLLLESEEDDDSYLPSPDDLGIDLTKDIE
jgi:hypothetical protein